MDYLIFEGYEIFPMAQLGTQVLVLCTLDLNTCSTPLTNSLGGDCQEEDLDRWLCLSKT